MENIKHPAKYSDNFIEIFASLLNKYDCRVILDPFAGTGKIGLVKKYGFDGIIYANEIEYEWLFPNNYKCDYILFKDAENIDIYNKFDAIVTSPTYGNRMADHHNARDSSKRITYTHFLGHDLNSENTGKMQWGKRYRDKHEKIYKNLYHTLKQDEIFIINISNHIRNGKEQNVVKWHVETLCNIGFEVLEEISVKTNRMKFGRNFDKRVQYEEIVVLRKLSNSQ